MGGRNRIYRLATLLLVVVILGPACDQRPLDLIVQEPEFAWELIDEFSPPWNHLQVAWGTSGTDVYVGLKTDETSGRLTLFHFDGNSWAPSSYPNSSSAPCLWGSGPRDVYAADGRLLHFDGDAWQEVAAPGHPYLVAGRGPDDVYTADFRAVYRFDGAYWYEVCKTDPQLSADGLWVGPEWSFAVIGSGKILQSDRSGSSVTELFGDPRGIWGVSADDLYIVGARSSDGCIWHSNGVEWTTVGIPDGTRRLNAIWGSSASEIYAVGDSGTILRFDGSAWRAIAPVTSQELVSIWGAGPDDIYVTGGFSTLLHFDGSTWTRVWEAEPLRPWVGWAESSSSMVVASLESGLHRFDGGRWSEMVIGVDGRCRAIDGTSISDLWASVGSKIIHFDGSSWSISADFGNKEQLAILALSAQDVFSLGYASIHHFDGASWETMNLDLTGQISLSAIWGDSPSDVFAVGFRLEQPVREGLVLRFDGSEWMPMPSGVEWALSDVWGTSPDDVYAVGGGVIHFDGERWTPMLSDRGIGIELIAGTASGQVIGCRGPWQFKQDGRIWTSALSELTALDLFTAIDGSLILLSYDSVHRYVE
jgi:hypothetical protein